MSRQGGNFFERHVEKLVLAVVGAVLVWLFATRVLVSPNKVLYDNRKLGPGGIDVYIAQQAKDLDKRLKLPAQPGPEYKKRVSEFISTIDSPISGIDTSLALYQPFHVLKKLNNKKYRIPQVGGVSAVAVKHFRAAAYLPVAAVDERNVYDAAKSKPNDIDFITVEAKFNVDGLYENFYETFASESVREEWRDPCLAQPVFAAVQLQRRELLGDGSWSDWRDVSRTRIDQRRDTFALRRLEKLPPGGIRVLLVQFNKARVRRDLLQPEAYRIASAEEEWFPPSIHEEYSTYQKKVEAQERRKELEEERKQREMERERGRYGLPQPGRYEGRTGRDAEPWTAAERGGREYDGRMPPPRRRDRRDAWRREERQPKSRESSETASSTDFYNELEKITITEQTALSKMTEPLVFWAHDDTVDPGRSYRYRIRLGVFNPVAGTDQTRPQDESKKDDVILWSAFSETTRTVEIPERLYFFPLDVREGAKAVTVQVSRYVLGYWYSCPFRVQQGEVIGRVVENKKVDDEATAARTDVTDPETIDYGTGAVLVDVRMVNGWSRGGNSLRPQYCSDMLYSLDGTTIGHIPVGQLNWPRELHARYLEIKKLVEKPHKPFRSWGSKAAQRKALERTSERVSDRDSEDSRKASEKEAWRRMMEKRGMKF